MEIDFLILKIIMQADIMSVTPQMQKQQIWMNNTRLELKIKIVILQNFYFVELRFFFLDSFITLIQAPLFPVWYRR